MKKEMHPTTMATYSVIVKNFRKGEVLSYESIGKKLKASRECARRHAHILASKRLVSIKGGHIVGVK